MSQLNWIKGDLFNASRGQILVHACNSEGVWGSGIAKNFKEKYPDAFNLYSLHCEKEDTVGQSGLSPFYYKQGHYIGWLITSKSYGKNKDTIDIILINSTLAIDDFCKKLLVNFPLHDKIIVNSNKFNSGLFGVQWEKTKLILQHVLKKYPKINWNVYSGEND